MALRVTIIEDSRESQIEFLRSLSTKVEVELQSVTGSPFLDERIRRAIKRFKPDLIILDLLLEEDIDSGFRVLGGLKETEDLKNIPVVVCSKFIGRDPKDENKKRAERLGAALALPKIPFPRAEKLLEPLRLDEIKTRDE
ncbi:MAG: hypothetical protein QOE77_822 [Blastocatellia bacterium]|nr:hypothetical protein [Blastocatellia bacterium]